MQINNVVNKRHFVDCCQYGGLRNNYIITLTRPSVQLIARTLFPPKVFESEIQYYS